MIKWLDSSSLGPVTWYPEPNERGTASILTSCLATLVLCSWTSLHLNAPERRKLRYTVIRRVGYMLLGLIAPEVIIAMAWQQRHIVHILTSHMRGYYRKHHAFSTRNSKVKFINKVRHFMQRLWRRLLVALWLRADDKHQDPADVFWTDMHSWLILSGGLVFDISDAEAPFFPEGRQRLTITPTGVGHLYYYFPHLLPHISTEDIESKCRTDALTKLITCVQALWFCAQCIVRLDQELPVSLLELYVFGHAACCLLLYAIWWSKPQGITDPFKITTPEAYPVAAAMCTSSRIGAYNISARNNILRWWVPTAKTGKAEDVPADSDDRVLPWLHIGGHGVCIGQTDWSFCNETGEQSRVWVPEVTLDKYTIRRLALLDDPELYRRVQGQRYEQLTSHIDNLKIHAGPFVNWLAYFGVLATSLLYGGLHAVAWNAVFPQPWQQTLWRVATISVMSTWIGNYIVEWAKVAVSRCFSESTVRPAATAIAQICDYGLATYYALCRGYLLVESFVNLAYLSPRVLLLPTWTKYVPHIA